MLGLKPNISKITEKLKILSERMTVVLIQIDSLKNLLQTENNFHSQICSNSAYESILRSLVKKFPNIDVKNNKSNIEPLTAIHSKILTELYFHYNTLVDVLEVKDNLMDLFGQISAFQYSLEISLSFDMTRTYLDLIANYSAMMIILSSITQIKSILLLYNFATLSKFDQDEPYYHRLCERLVEKHKDGGAITEIHNELNPYSRTIINAINSLASLVKLKQESIIEWDKGRKFNLISSTKPDNLLNMSPSVLLPYCQIERWIIFGYLSVYPELLKNPSALQLWRSVLSFSFSIVLFRGENLQIHPFLSKYLELQRGYTKLTNIVKEVSKEFTNNSTGFHRSRRNYLRMAMRNQLQIIGDFPGCMAPNVMIICQTITSAVDELHWLIRHNELIPSKKYSSIKTDDFNDQLLPEFIHQIEELRFNLQQFNVMEKYYRIVLQSIDFPKLKNYIDSFIDHFSDDDLEILHFFSEKLENINIDQSNEPALSDADSSSFKDLRLDWFRLQTYLSSINAKFPWQQSQEFIQFMNSIVLHSNLVDNLSNFIDKFSSMQFLYFHRNKVNEWFELNLKTTAQHRYAVVFPRICGHFINNCQSSCPDDFNLVLRSSVEMAHTYLSRICQELCKLLTDMVKMHFDLNLKLQPNNAVDFYLSHLSKKAKDCSDFSNHSKSYSKIVVPPLPGIESKPSDITKSNTFDMQLIALNQLATGLNSRPLLINNRTFQPNLYLKKELLKFLNDKFVTLSSVKIKRDKSEIAGTRRPSEMLLIIKECMSLVMKVSEFVNINTAKLFMDAFLRQSLTKEFMGFTTLTEIYCNWYVDFVLNQPYTLHTPLLKCFITLPQNQKEVSNVIINVEEYTDIEELRALVEVIGPFGMKALYEKIMQLIVKYVSLLRRFVMRNRSTLIELNVINLDYSKIKKLLLNIEDVNEFCQHWKQMGILFVFKDLCREALNDVVRKTMPFLKSTVVDLQQDFDANPIDQLSSVSEHDSQIYAQCRNQLEINELCQGFGLKTKVDSTLFNAIESLKIQQQQLQSGQGINIDQMEDQTNELLIAATSYLLPRIVGSNFYHVEYEALEESAHCTAYAIKELMYVFFFKYGEDRLDDQIRRFIALTSSNLLRLGLETGSSSQTNKDEMILINNRDSIYIFFDFIIQTLENISDDFYEECFPYALVRQAYHNVVKQSRLVMTKAAHPTDASSKAAMEAYKVDNK